MSNSRIEQIIEDIEAYIDSCKPPLFSSGDKILVDREHMEELLRELRLKTPEEIKRYQRILANKDAILEDAQIKANAIIEQANIQNQELVNEHEIMQQAYARANQIIEMATNQAQETVNNATRDANEIRLGAIEYTDDLLAEVQDMVKTNLETITAHYQNVCDDFKKLYDMIVSNREELRPGSGQAPVEEPEEVPEEEQE